MTATGPRTLVTGLDPNATALVRGHLTTLQSWLDEATWEDAITDRLRSVRYDLVVVGFPIVGRPALGHFLQAARHRDSASQRAGIVLLTAPETVGGATAYVGRGVNQVISWEHAAKDLPDIATRLLEVAPRYPVRAPTRVVVHTRPAPRRAFCQTENLSRSGVLLRGFGHYPLGTRIEFEMTLPGEKAPIRGVGQVCRTTNFATERLEGFGAAFTDFQGGDRARLERYLEASDD